MNQAKKTYLEEIELINGVVEYLPTNVVKDLFTAARKKLDDAPKNTNIMQLMHDAVSPTNRVISLIGMLKKEITLLGPVKDLVEKIETSAKEINVAIDVYYKLETNNECEHEFDCVGMLCSCIKCGELEE